MRAARAAQVAPVHAADERHPPQPVAKRFRPSGPKRPFTSRADPQGILVPDAREVVEATQLQTEGRVALRRRQRQLDAHPVSLRLGHDLVVDAVVVRTAAPRARPAAPACRRHRIRARRTGSASGGRSRAAGTARAGAEAPRPPAASPPPSRRAAGARCRRRASRRGAPPPPSTHAVEAVRPAHTRAPGLARGRVQRDVDPVDPADQRVHELLATEGEAIRERN